MDCQKHGSYKPINSKETMTRIFLTLHIGLGMEITVTLFLILLNSNKSGESQKYASVILLFLIQSLHLVISDQQTASKTIHIKTSTIRNSLKFTSNGLMWEIICLFFLCEMLRKTLLSWLVLEESNQLIPERGILYFK